MNAKFGLTRPQIKPESTVTQQMLHHSTTGRFLLQNKFALYRLVDRAGTPMSLKQKVLGSNLGSVKSETVLPTARHH